jgi:hypothetical protein
VTAGPAILVILVATGEAQDPATLALVSSVEDAAGAALTVRVEETRTATDAEALRLERGLHAAAVAVVTWHEPPHVSATVRVHIARNDTWTSRRISFTPQDATAERGRTLGLVVAALWSAGQPAAVAPARPHETPATTAPGPSSSPPAPPAPPARAPPPATPVADTQTPATLTARASTSAPRPPDAIGDGRRPRFAVGAAGVGVLGVDGPASGVGVALEGVAFVTDGFALRLGASARTGPFPALPGSDTVATAGAGVEVWPLRVGRDALFSVGLRADALALIHRVRADADGGPAETHDRWLPGGDLRVQAALRLGRRVDWLLGVGAEAAAGATEIRKGASRATVATIPALRLLGETGLRLMF